MTVFLTAVPLAAQPKHIPAGDRTVVGSETKACYGLDDYKSLLKFDVDHDTCLKVRGKLTEKNALILDTNAALKSAIVVQKDSIKLMTKDRDHWFEEWKEENKKRHIAENKPALGSYLAWGTAGAFAVATAVLTAVVVIKD